MAWIRLFVLSALFALLAGIAVAYQSPTYTREAEIYKLINLKVNYVNEINEGRLSACGNYFVGLRIYEKEFVVFFFIASIHEENERKIFNVSHVLAEAKDLTFKFKQVTEPTMTIEIGDDKYYVSLTMSREEYRGSPCLASTKEP